MQILVSELYFCDPAGAPTILFSLAKGAPAELLLQFSVAFYLTAIDHTMWQGNDDDETRGITSYGHERSGETKEK